jgi:hypothetical protein
MASVFVVLEQLYSSKQLKKNRLINDSMISVLSKIQETVNVATIPYHLGGGWRIIAETSHNWLYNTAGLYLDKGDRLKAEGFLYKYPVLNISRLDEMVKEYQLSLIFISQEIYLKFKVPEKKLLAMGMGIERFNDIIVVADLNCMDIVKHHFLHSNELAIRQVVPQH